MALDERFSPLVARLQTIDDLTRAGAVLAWDQQTYMPAGGNDARGEQLATVARFAHRELTAPELGELLERLEEVARELAPQDERRALLRATRKAYDREVKLPADLVEEWQRASSNAYAAWVAARAEKHFGRFAPALGRIVSVQRQVADALGYPEEPYDALLDLDEPGMTARKGEALLDELKATLVPLTREIERHPGRVDRSVLFQHYPEQAQWQAGVEAVTAFGFDFGRGRLDRSIHPFTTSFGVGDVRITTRIDERYFGMGFFGTLHEGGHGLYEQGLPANWERTPLGKPISGGVHESQSRMWENLVGRSRAFWTYFLPRAQRHFPAQLGSVGVDAMYRAVNYVEPSLVRVEADEVTYNLHIAMRFEIERLLLRGELSAEDVAQAWVERMRAYLGVEPPNDLEGALQDIHWTWGLGSFLGYTVGNVVSVQLLRAAEREIGDLTSAIEQGQFRPLLDFLRRELHSQGAREKTDEMLRRVTGEGLAAKPYLEYITRKYGEIYGL